jgi:hypothetical protein
VTAHRITAEQQIAAYKHLQNFYSFSLEISSIRKSIANGELSFEYQVSEELKSFVERITQFAAEV